MMRQLLKIMNYAAHLLALINLGESIKRRATKSNIKKQKERPKIKTQMTSPSKKPPTTKKKKRNRLIYQRLRFLVVIPTVLIILQHITET
jgi:hypothetical protein